MPILSSFAGLSAKALGFFYNLRLTWSQKSSLDNNYTCRKAIYAPFGSRNYFVFGGNSFDLYTNKYQYSADGLTWSVGTLPTGTVSDAAFNGTTLVAVSSSNIGYTTNGSDWTVVETTTNTTPYTSSEYRLNPDGNIIWDGTRFLLSGQAAIGDIDIDTDEPEYIEYGLYYSTDGQSWTGTNDVSTAVNMYSYIPQTGTYFSYQARVGIGNSGYFICTSNPLSSGNWTKLTLPITTVTNFEYGNGIYLAGKSSTTEYAISEDGTTWIEYALPVEQTGKIAFVGGKFRFYASDKIYASLNGIDWTIEKTFSATTLDKVNSWFNAENIVYGMGQRSDTTKATDTYIYGA